MNGSGMGAVVVTGGSRGIGAEIVRALAARGVAVCINHRDSAREAEALAAELAADGADVSVVRADMALEGDIVSLFRAAEARHGRLSGLVNNAGYVGQSGRRVDECEAAVITQSFVVNAVAPFLCAREFLRRASRRQGGQGGRIVNISSIAKRTGSANDWVDYAASKAALDTFTLGLAKEVATEGVTVNGVAPGVVDTEIHARAGSPERLQRMAGLAPMKRVGRPDEIAATAVWLLMDAPEYMTGVTIDVAGGL